VLLFRRPDSSSTTVAAESRCSLLSLHRIRSGAAIRKGVANRGAPSNRPACYRKRRLGSSATDVTWRSHLEHGSQVREPDALSRARSSSWPSGGGARFALTAALTWSTGDVMARFSLFLSFHFLSFPCSLSPRRDHVALSTVRDNVVIAVVDFFPFLLRLVSSFHRYSSSTLSSHWTLNSRLPIKNRRGPPSIAATRVRESSLRPRVSCCTYSVSMYHRWKRGIPRSR